LLAQEVWVCAHPGIINNQETTVVERYRVEGAELVENSPLRETRFQLLFNGVDGLIAVMRPRVAGKDYIQVWVVLIDKKQLTRRSVVVAIGIPPAAVDANCIKG
jgi:hypothetical protein